MAAKAEERQVAGPLIHKTHAEAVGGKIRSCIVSQSYHASVMKVGPVSSGVSSGEGLAISFGSAVTRKCANSSRREVDER